MKEGATMSEEGATMSEEGATMSEEGATMSEEGATMSEEGATMSEERATMSEEGATVSEKGQIIASDTGSDEELGEALSNGNPIPPKRGKGRPKGSGSKTPKILRVLDKQPRGRPRKVVDPNAVSAEPTAPLKHGRPQKVKQPKKMGRPRKNPLSTEEEEKRKKPKSQPKGSRVSKPLGRLRIHPCMDPPATSAEPRGRGRPRKAIIGKGAHLRKNPPPTSKVSKPPVKDGSPRKSPLGSVLANNAKRAAEKDSSNSAPPAKRGCTVSPIVKLYRCTNGKANVLDEAAIQAQRRRGRRKTVKVDYTTYDSEEEEDAEKNEDEDLSPVEEEINPHSDHYKASKPGKVAAALKKVGVVSKRRGRKPGSTKKVIK
ncbi:myoneurin-like [Oncorhynchus clarkii lewisi]|uniref:myoneurin-like n=1 Tax=Oncorhynchus clarkii lewisi TaxID=490388 RepID=UPI0039B93DF4